MELVSFFLYFSLYIWLARVGAVPMELVERRTVLKDLSNGFCRAVWLTCK